MIYLMLLMVTRISKGYDLLSIAPDYQKHARPLNRSDPADPLLVEAVLNLRNIVAISEAEQQISLEVSFKMYWTDPSISIKKGVIHYDGVDRNRNYILAPTGFETNMWIPDVFIDKAINIREPKMYIKPSSVRVYNDSLIRYNTRMNFDVACRMEFAKFPADEQECMVRFESFSYLSKDLQLVWAAKGHNLPDNNMTAQFQFHVEREAASTKYKQQFSALRVRIHFKRMITFHLAQTYAPSIFFVVLGWMVLLLPVEAVPGRVGLGTITLLTLTTMNSAVRSRLPQVSYMTFMDFWVIGCFLFVFVINATSVTEIAMDKVNLKSPSRLLNKIGIFLFPLLFTIFNAVYWPLLYMELENVDTHNTTQ